MWWDPRFLIPPAIAAAIDRGRAHLDQETNPVRRLELEQLLRSASRGVPQAVDKLLALGPAPVRAKIYEKRDPYYLTRKEAYQEQQRENAAAYAVAKVRELYNSLLHGDPQTPLAIPFDFAQRNGLLQADLTKVQQDAEEKLKREKEEYLKKSRDENDEALRQFRALREGIKQAKAECVWQELLQRRFLFFDHFNNIQLLTGCSVYWINSIIRAYIPLLEYPSVQEVLKPYYTCLFAQSWKDNFPKHAKLMAGLRRSMLEWVQSLRSKDLEARQESEIYIRKRDGRWFIFEPLLSYDEDYYQRPRFTGSVLESFQRFLKQNGEGALFVLLLLMTVGHPGEVQSDSIFYKHPKPEPEEWRPRPIYDLVYAERNFPLPKIWGDSRENGLYERYPGFNMSYFPVLDDRDPLDVLLSLERVAEIISDLNTVDFTKYYWRCDGGDPYKAYRETYHYSEVLVVPKTRKGIFTKELEKREDLQLLWRKFIQKRRWHWQEIMVGKPHWPVGYEKLIKMYLDCRACDIARYGQKVANLTFPQPTIEGATSKQVADLVASLVTLLQEHTLQKEKQEDEEMIANLKEKAQRIFDEKFSNKMIPMPDIHRLALTYNEIEALKAACLKELRQGEK